MEKPRCRDGEQGSIDIFIVAQTSKKIQLRPSRNTAHLVYY